MSALTNLTNLTMKSTSLLAEQFADVYQLSQEEYRNLIAALRDESVDLEEFSARAIAHAESLIRLKRIRIQLRSEREELSQLETRR